MVSFGVSAAQRRLKCQGSLAGCVPQCVHLFPTGREGDKTQDLGLQWLGIPGQALLQAAAEAGRVLVLSH